MLQFHTTTRPPAGSLAQRVLFDAATPTVPPAPTVPTHAVATSQAAAESILPVAGTLSANVLDYIESHGGATMHEITAGTGILLQTVCGRIADLRTRGLVRDSGTERPTPSGRGAVVWMTTRTRGTSHGVC